MTGDEDGQPGLRELLREDFETHRRSRVSPGFHALAVYRLGRAVYRDDTPVRRLGRPLYRLGQALVTAAYGIELPLSCRIGRRLFLPHPHGVVFVPGSRIGDDCLVRHNVTLGAAGSRRPGRPVVGDRVQFGPGSIVMGAVTVGDDALIGPGAVVVEDVPAGGRARAPKAIVLPGPAEPGTGSAAARAAED